jgi:hypothetical protein
MFRKTSCSLEDSDYKFGRGSGYSGEPNENAPRLNRVWSLFLPLTMNPYCQIEYVSSDNDVGTLRRPAGYERGSSLHSIILPRMPKYAADIGRWIIVLALAGLLVAGVWEAYSYRREMFLVILLWVAVLADLWKYWIVPLTLMAVYMYYRKSKRK